MINDELFDKNLVSTKGIENYISNSKDKFKKHLHFGLTTKVD